MTYAGDLSPVDAHHLLLERPNSVLIDCRTKAEWSFVGIPDVSGIRLVEWTSWPSGAPNRDFVAQATTDLEPDQPVVVVCRSGHRSVAAGHALAAAGFTQVFNVLEGFEGDLDGNGQRRGGWRGAGLPWHQS